MLLVLLLLLLSYCYCSSSSSSCRCRCRCSCSSCHFASLPRHVLHTRTLLLLPVRRRNVIPPKVAALSRELSPIAHAAIQVGPGEDSAVGHLERSGLVVHVDAGLPELRRAREERVSQTKNEYEYELNNVSSVVDFCRLQRKRDSSRVCLPQSSLAHLLADVVRGGVVLSVAGCFAGHHLSLCLG